MQRDWDTAAAYLSQALHTHTLGTALLPVHGGGLGRHPGWQLRAASVWTLEQIGDGLVTSDGKVSKLVEPA